MNKFNAIIQSFDMIEYITKRFLGQEVNAIEDSEGNIIGFKIKGAILPCIDELEIYPAVVTGNSSDYAKGEVFATFSKHEDWKKYNCIQLIMALEKVNYEVAKNMAIKYIKNGYADIVDSQSPPVDELNDEIPYILNEKGKPYKTWENLDILLKHKGIKVRYDMATKKPTIDGMEGLNKESPTYNYDVATTHVNSICEYNGLSLNNNLHSFLQAVAYKHVYSSVVEFLEECKQTYLAKHTVSQSHNRNYFNQLMGTLTFKDEHEKEFGEVVLFKWLLSAVNMAYNLQGQESSHFIPVFIGKQGLGKTTWVKRLVPQDKRNMFVKEGVTLKPKDKDSVMKASQYWICEVGEIGKTLTESGRDDLKNFITESIDTYRVPYGRTVSSYPRTTVFFGSVNDEKFLRDETGNRRFVPLELIGIDYMHDIDMRMVWGELTLMYESKRYGTYLDNDLIERNEERNKERIVDSHEKMLLEHYIAFNQPKEEWRYITSASIAIWLKEQHGITINDCRKIGKALSTMGYEAERKRIGGQLGRYYLLPYINGYSLPL